MVKEVLMRELNSLISGCLQSNNFELIDLLSRPTGAKLILTVLVDKPKGNGLASASQSHEPQGGITLEECAQLSRQLKNLLEEKNIIDGDYVLEVSSPGLDRSLKQPKDFLRSLNQEAVFFLNDLENGKCQWQGLICKVDAAAVFIQVSGGILEIPFIKINKAQLVI